MAPERTTGIVGLLSPRCGPHPALLGNPKPGGDPAQLIHLRCLWNHPAHV